VFLYFGDLQMALKEFWSKTSSWLRTNKLAKLKNYQPQVDDQGLISENSELTEQAAGDETAQNDRVVVKALQPRSKAESIEKLQAGFDKLIEQLQGINEHLDRQVAQNEDLMSRIEQLPQLLESFPAVVENQKQLTEQLLEQLKTDAAKGQQFMDAVEKIPTETAKQTDALTDINHQLSAAANADVQMAESFNKFNDSLDKLGQSTNNQTDSIMQMSRTFAASDRYLKYIMSRQRKSFMWVFMIAMGICVLAILILTGIIIYLRQ
jgi:methyl-accepting chemotaxis protein